MQVEIVKITFLKHMTDIFLFNSRWWCCQWKWGFSSTWKRSIPRDPHMGGVVVRFIEIEVNTKGCPGFSSSPLSRKSNLVFIRPRNRASAQTFCTVGSVHVRPHPASKSVSLALCQLALPRPRLRVCIAVRPQVAARATWLLWRENALAMGPARVSRQE